MQCMSKLDAETEDKRKIQLRSGSRSLLIGIVLLSCGIILLALDVAVFASWTDGPSPHKVLEYLMGAGLLTLTAYSVLTFFVRETLHKLVAICCAIGALAAFLVNMYSWMRVVGNI